MIAMSKMTKERDEVIAVVAWRRTIKFFLDDKLNYSIGEEQSKDMQGGGRVSIVTLNNLEFINKQEQKRRQNKRNDIKKERNFLLGTVYKANWPKLNIYWMKWPNGKALVCITGWRYSL